MPRKPAKNPPKKRKPASGRKCNFPPAPIGNQLWKLRSSHGRKPKFANGEQLWNACVEYFDWVEANPLQQEKLFSYEGEIVRGNVAKMRAMTQNGLCTFLDISPQAWANFRLRADLADTVDLVDRIIYDYKFTGAAADLLNVAIIARELGLRDNVDHSVKFSDMTEEQLNARLEQLLRSRSAD